MFYNSRLCRNLRRLLLSNASVFKDKAVFDWQAVRAARTIRQFDQAVIVPMFEYPDLDHYYRGQ